MINLKPTKRLWVAKSLSKDIQILDQFGVIDEDFTQKGNAQSDYWCLSHLGEFIRARIGKKYGVWY